MAIQLSDHFTYKRLFRFAIPSILMMVFTSIYGVVDGFFVSNYVGKTAFAAVNFIMPVLMILGAFGFMFGTGGSALVSKTLGEGNAEKAKSLFSMLVYVSIATGVGLAAAGIAFMRPIAAVLGASGQMLDDCVIYGRIILAALPFFMLQQLFQSFFVTAERPKTGLYVTLAAGCTNMLLDWLFVGVFRWGIVGAAAATGVSQAVGGLVPLLLFIRPKTGVLALGKAAWDGRALLKACTNGSSELMSNVSMSLVGMLYNAQLMEYAGENGVAAYGVMMYVSFIFIAVFIGYSIGTAPVVGYHYGAGNKGELKSLFRKSMTVILALSVLMVGVSELCARPLSSLFVGMDEELFNLTVRGFIIFSLAFFFSGVGIYGSAFFTALNNGLISAIISFLRTLVFQVGGILLLPIFWGIDGIWWSIVAADMLAAVVTTSVLLFKRKQYGY